MSLLAIILLATLLLTWAFLGIVGRADGWGTAWLIIKLYVFLTFWLLLWLVTGHLGVAEWDVSTARMPLDDQRLFTHVGYYIAPQDSFVFHGGTLGSGFTNELLSSDERIVAVPAIDASAADPVLWTVRGNVSRRPLRVDGRWINVPTGGLLSPGEALRIVRVAGTDTSFLALRWSTGRTWAGNPTDTLEVRLGSGIGDPTPSDVYEPVSNTVLSEGYALSGVLRWSPPPTSRSLQALAPAWWRVLDQVTLVREIQGDRSSPIGALVPDPLLSEPGLRFFVDAPGATSSLRVAPLDRDVGGGEKRVSYGLGPRSSFSIRLASTTEQDPSWGTVVEAHLGESVRWPLPPEPDSLFVITSGADRALVPGYSVPVGAGTGSFYVKARLNAGRDSIHVSDGATPRAFPRDAAIRLGNHGAGVVFSFESRQAAVGFVGWKAAGILFLLTLVFLRLAMVESKGEQSNRLQLEKWWAVVWAGVLTLLTVRLILAHRLSYAPPTDATSLELWNVFHKSLESSLTALWLIPSAMLVARAASLRVSVEGARASFEKVVERLRARRVARALVWLAPPAWVAAAAVSRAGESFMGLRTNLLTIVLVAVALTVAPDGLWTEDEGGVASRRRWSAPLLKALPAVLSLVVTFAVMVVWVGDTGFLIFAFAASMIVSSALSGFGAFRKRGWLLGGTVAVVLFVLFFLLPAPVGVLLRSFGNQQAEYVSMRLASASGGSEEILLNRDGAELSEARNDLLRRNTHQRWQMLLFASEGAREPAGLGGAPLSRVGMTYPTSATDCVFAIYIVAEHGWPAGLLLTMILVGLGWAILRAMSALPDYAAGRRTALLTIGVFFAGTTLFVASANVGLASFTGQNIPLFGLSSNSDLLQSMVLLVLVTVLTRAGVHRARTTPGTPVLSFSHSIVATGVVWVGVLAYWLASLPGRDAWRDDFNMPDEVFDVIEREVIDEDRNNAWELTGTQLVREPSATTPSIAALYAEQFNQKLNKYDPTGFFYLDPTRGRAPRLRFNRSYFLVRSPYRPVYPWTGSISASSRDAGPAVGALGRVFEVTFAPGGHAESVPLDSLPPERVNRSVLVRGNPLAGNPTLFELERTGDGLMLAGVKQGTNVTVYHEGRVVGPADGPIPLRPNDLIGVRGDGFHRTLMYFGPQASAVASTRWRNNSWKREFPLGPTVPVAFAISGALDFSVRDSLPVPEAVELTLELALQAALEDSVHSYARRTAEFVDSDPLTGRRLAVSVLDSYTGEVLAMGSWPPIDVNANSYRTAVDRSSGGQTIRLLGDTNLRNHAVGSTIKPLVFSAMAASLWPDYDVSSLELLSAFPRNSQGLLEVCGIPIGNPDNWTSGSPPINADTYLTSSLNNYQMLLGILGIALSPEDLEDAFVAGDTILAMELPSSNPNAPPTRQLRGCDLKRVAESSLSLADRIPSPRTSAFDRTLLLRGMRATTTVAERDTDDREGFIPGLEEVRGGRAAFFRADPVQLGQALFTDIRRDYVSFLLGAGTAGRFSNVWMSEAMARLVTGRRIRARLGELRPGDEVTPALDMPPPLNDRSWREAHIIEPLRAAGTAGTARAMSTLRLGNMRALYKTGTIREADPVRESEVLLFTVGEWTDSTSFVPGKTVTGTLYMEDSKLYEGGSMKKFDFAKAVLAAVIDYLRVR